MPGDVPAHRNDGAHRLIQEGAGLVTRAEDILIEYEARWPGLLDFEAAGKAQEAMAVFQGGKVRAARRPEPPKPSPPRADGEASGTACRRRKTGSPAGWGVSPGVAGVRLPRPRARVGR